MGKLKEFFYPAHAGLDYIYQANVEPIVKIKLLYQWRNPHASGKALRNLKSLIQDLEAANPQGDNTR